MGRGGGSGRVVVVVVVDTCRSGNVHHESRSEQAVHAKCPETHISVSGILVELFFLKIFWRHFYFLRHQHRGRL